MWDDPKANGNVGMKKERTTARQAECNVQSLINQCVDIMQDQMKGIENGNKKFVLSFQTYEKVLRTKQ
jgi:hypothetical protein